MIKTKAFLNMLSQTFSEAFKISRLLFFLFPIFQNNNYRDTHVFYTKIYSNLINKALAFFLDSYINSENMERTSNNLVFRSKN